MLDLIADRTKALQGELGAERPRSARRVSRTVREIERRVAKAAAARPHGRHAARSARSASSTKFDEQVKLMFDLIALAYQANLTRVASYMMVAEGTNRTYNHIGVSDAFHPLSHHANDKERIDKLVKIQRYHVERFADFVDKIAATPDGDGSLLDHSLLHVRLEHEQQRPAQQLSAAGHARRRRERRAARAASTSSCRITRRSRTCISRCSTRPGSSSRASSDSTGEIAGV